MRNRIDSWDPAWKAIPSDQQQHSLVDKLSCFSLTHASQRTARSQKTYQPTSYQASNRLHTHIYYSAVHARTCTPSQLHNCHHAPCYTAICAVARTFSQLFYYCVCYFITFIYFVWNYTYIYVRYVRSVHVSQLLAGATNCYIYAIYAIFICGRMSALYAVFYLHMYAYTCTYRIVAAVYTIYVRMCIIVYVRAHMQALYYYTHCHHIRGFVDVY